MQRFDKITAAYMPQRTDDLKEGVANWIGWETEWSAYWIIDEGPYQGQWAMGPKHDPVICPPFAWVPLCDLKELTATKG